MPLPVIFLVLRSNKYQLLQHLSVSEKRFLALAVLAHLIATWFSVGFHHPDEHYQLVEFACYKMGMTPAESLPWEFPARMRPGLQPLMVYLLMKPYYALGFSNPYNFALLLRFITGLATIWTALQFHKAVSPQIKSETLRRVHFLLSLLGWGLVYLHVRFSSETWCAIAFTWAVIALWRGGRYSYFWFGLLAGLSFVFRFQAIFMIGGAGLWMLFVSRPGWKPILQTVLGFMLAFGIGLLCERWLYGEWTVSSFAYVYQNIVENRAAAYGVEPWYWYFEQIIIQGLAPFSIIMLLSIPVMLLYKPRHILTWSMILFLLGHIVVAHKEFRFLYPLAFFFPFFAVSTLAFFGEKLAAFDNRIWYQKTKKVFAVSFWIANGIALLLIITKPSSDIIALNKVLYDNLKKETIIVYSYEFNPYVSGDTMGATFYANPLISSHCIDEYINDTLALKGKDVWIFSEHAYAKDEFIFQYAGPFFDSSKTKVIWRRLPEWTYKFNFNGWLERSNPYTIYRLYNHRVR